eukprot:TRINITY_DN3777_c0_g3_i2.p1 TRINITY_DN3777_c0_g3~~TRINITY_DN3777_c0_g3_i2.p1  ORF type:complete len:209 (+),score=30.40 TRINITY_DN3777_c0_g3_i2:270-896(+)
MIMSFLLQQSLPAVRHRKSSTFNIQAEKWMLPFTLVNAALRLQCTLELKSEGATTQEVDENPLNERESLMQQQSPHNTQQGSHLTNERTSDNAEDTGPSNSTLALDEDGLGDRQLSRQQQSPQNTRWISALMEYEATDHTSPSDYRVTIRENEPDLIQPLTLQQTLQNARQIIGFHRLSDATPIEYMPAAIFVVFFLLVLLHLFRVIG